MIKRLAALIAMVLSLPGAAMAQTAITGAEKDAAIDVIAAHITDNYVYPERTEAFIKALNQRRASRAYDDITSHEALATVLTKDLVDITQDKHFLVAYNPGLVAYLREREAAREAPAQEPDNAEPNEQASSGIDPNVWFAEQSNFGFGQVEVLPGNIGYVKVGFFEPLHMAQPKIDATMAFLSDTRALIIDLTEHQGGYSPTDAYWASYFFDGEQSLWSSTYDRPDDETTTVSLFPHVLGDKYLDRPVYVLTSNKTFSLAEQFAYGLKHFDKAIIVGQTSAGAAHAIDVLVVNDNLFIQVPKARNLHPVTQRDWEGIGVIPHIEVPVTEARKTAHLDALDGMIAEASTDWMLKALNSARVQVTGEVSSENTPGS